jgi:RNA polymerase sigma factor (sigma-70 family)
MDPQEFKIQVYQFRDKLFRFARRILDQTEEAEDVVQEVFLRLWSRRDTLSGYKSIEALAMTVTRNLCLDRIRKRKFPVGPLEDHRQFLENLPTKQAPDYSEELRLVKLAMESLPVQQKMIVQLRDVEEYEFDTIAGIMEMNENSVRVSLSRARKRIREIIDNHKLYEYQRN